MPEGIRGQPLRYSRFHCRELIYEYMSGRLDAQRREAVEAGLEEYPDLKDELSAMISANQYCSELGKITPNESLIESFQQIRLNSEIVSEKVKYKNWPDLLRWSSEAIVISIFVAAVGWLIPWSSVQNIFKVEPSNEVVLADLDTKNKTDIVVPPLEKKELPPQTAQPLPTAQEVTKVEPTKPAIAAAPAVVVSPVAPAVPSVPAPTAQAPVKPIAAAIPEKKKGPQGFLYRIMMNVAGIQNSAPALAEQIISLGGEKAGQVEIGHRQSTGNYFHFSMPESNYQRLLKTLGTYGPVRIYKGPHERVMPEGVIRIILNIEDAKGKTPTVKPPASGKATGSTTEANENTDSTATPAESLPTTEAQPADDTSSTGE